jgi:hypothetical protein
MLDAYEQQYCCCFWVDVLEAARIDICHHMIIMDPTVCEIAQLLVLIGTDLYEIAMVHESGMVGCLVGERQWVSGS